MSYAKIKLPATAIPQPHRAKALKFIRNANLAANLSMVWIGLLLLGCSTNSPTPLTHSAMPNSATPNPANPLFTASHLDQPQSLPLRLVATINGKTLKLAVAKTVEQQRLGLMFRTTLAEGEGMLFPFDPPRPVGFWMKNTLIPLDMLYIRSGMIRVIKADVPPCQKDPCPSYPSQVEIDQVIEIRGGLAAELGFKVGDRVTMAELNNPELENLERKN
jgi:uncharacterized protein